MADFLPLDGIIKGKDPATGNKVALSAIQNASGDWVLKTVLDAEVQIDEKPYASTIKEHTDFAWPGAINSFSVGENISNPDPAQYLNVSEYKGKIIHIKNGFTLNDIPKSMRYGVRGVLRTGGTSSTPYIEIVPATTVLSAGASITLTPLTHPALSLPFLELVVNIGVDQYSIDRPNGGVGTVLFLGESK
jgi:hypothetical protein